jgi:lipid II:glycine glycyltransferase (peptidoglycan interpeptide bridge formation enzyme)
MIYKYGASNPKLLYYRPNEILFFEAIKMAKEKKLEIFDFGISKINNFGLRHFKSGFGATESPVSYSVMSNKPIKKKGKTGDNKVIKFIIRHSPLWLIRLIGELFYKFAA